MRLDPDDWPTLQTFLGDAISLEPTNTFHLSLLVEPGAKLASAVDPAPSSWHYRAEGSQVELLFRPPFVPGDWTHHFWLDFAQGLGRLRMIAPGAPDILSYKTVFPAFLDRFIFSEIFNYRGDGCFVHSASLIDEGRGLLLVGESGAGKSTSSRIWRESGGPGVIGLSDEFSLLLRQPDGAFWVYGTPWPSQAGIANHAGARLDRIYCLQHASDNQATSLDSEAALIYLLRQGQLSVWNSLGLSASLDLLIALSQTVPIYELGFRPDPSVITFVREHGLAQL